MDFYQDNDQSQICQILKIAMESGLNIPDYVLNKPETDEKELAQLPKLSFADPETRSFPMHTKADTWLSAAYSTFNSPLLSKTAKARVKKMLHTGADLWDFSPETLNEIDSVMSQQLEKQASEKEAAETAVTPDNFAEYCHDVCDRLTSWDPPKRHTVCAQVLKTASENNLTIPSQCDYPIRVCAHDGIGYKDDVLDWLRQTNQTLSKKSMDTHKDYTMTCISAVKKCASEVLDNQTSARITDIMDLVLRDANLIKTADDLSEMHTFGLTDVVKQHAANAFVHAHAHVIEKTAMEDNFDRISQNLEAITGDKSKTIDELVTHLNKVAPLTADRCLAPVL